MSLSEEEEFSQYVSSDEYISEEESEEKDVCDATEFDAITELRYYYYI